MRVGRKEGNKFSFAAEQLEDIESAAATPKFPSIEISKDVVGGSERKSNRPVQLKKGRELVLPSEQKSKKDKQPSYQQFAMYQPEKKEKTNRFSKPSLLLLSDDTKSVESLENKSISSIQSLREKLAKRSIRQQQKLIQARDKIHKREKHSHSLSNLLDYTFESPKSKGSTGQRKRMLRNFKSTDSFQPFIASSSKECHNQSTTSTRRETITVTNNYIQPLLTPKAKQLVQNIKIIKTNQRIRRSIITDKGKSFKNLLNKARPVLQLQGRQLTNDRIESMANHYEEFEEVQYL